MSSRKREKTVKVETKEKRLFVFSFIASTNTLAAKKKD